MTIKDDLTADVPVWLMRADVTEDVMVRVFKLAAAQLRRDLDIRAQQSVYTINTSTQTDDNAVPIDKVIYVRSITVDSQGHDLEIVPIKVLRERPEFYLSGTPRFAAIEGDSIVLAPAPSGPMTLTVSYVRTPQDFELPLVSPNYMGDFAYDVVLNLCCAYAAQFVHDFELKDFYFNEYRRGVAELNRLESFAMSSGAAPTRVNNRY